MSRTFFRLKNGVLLRQRSKSRARKRAILVPKNSSTARLNSSKHYGECGDPMGAGAD